MLHANGFAELRAHARQLRKTSLRRLFAENPDRFSDFSRRDGGLLVDLSKNLAVEATIPLLARLAREAGVEARREAMFAGQEINTTEGRAVLHTALRADPATGSGATVGGRSVDGEIQAELVRFLAFAGDVRSGRHAGAGGRRFTDVINIGIGGSDLGPAMAVQALAPYADGPRVHFVSNVDGAHLAETLKGLAPATTLALVASKTFTTQETMANARAARRWIAAGVGEAEAGRHFAALSTARDKVIAFGIDPDRMFGFWDWVGGRYSIWSAIGTSLAIAIGPERFRAFLAGGRAMDRHFRSADPERNLPLLMAMFGVLHRNGFGWPAHAVLPYDQRLARFPAYLQQLDMESNGKGVGLGGRRLTRPSGPIIFGEPGTNGQHAFYQLLHQGTDVIPADFLVAASGHEPEMADQHAMLLANCLAQTEALMKGRTLAEAKAQLAAQGMPANRIARLAPHKVFSGNRPTTTILYPRLDPATLGSLIALYEHKVFVQGVVWGVNSYDQWGVELGKELANGLLPMVEGKVPVTGRDGSTAGLLAAIRSMR
jgi:glucose-6-phosphate isomerase